MPFHANIFSAAGRFIEEKKKRVKPVVSRVQKRIQPVISNISRRISNITPRVPVPARPAARPSFQPITRAVSGLAGTARRFIEPVVKPVQRGLQQAELARINLARESERGLPRARVSQFGGAMAAAAGDIGRVKDKLIDKYFPFYVRPQTKLLTSLPLGTAEAIGGGIQLAAGRKPLQKIAAGAKQLPGQARRMDVESIFANPAIIAGFAAAEAADIKAAGLAKKAAKAPKGLKSFAQEARKLTTKIVESTDNNGIPIKNLLVNATPIKSAKLDELLVFAKKKGLNPTETDDFLSLIKSGEIYRNVNQYNKRLAKTNTSAINIDKVKSAYTDFYNQAVKGIKKEPALFGKALTTAEPRIPKKERGFIKTVREAPTTAPEVAQIVKGKYIPITNRATLNQARYVIENEGWDVAKEYALKGELNPVNNTIGQELMRIAQNQKRYDEAIEIAEALAKRGTRGGQYIQSFSIWSRLTPEGMLRYAAKTVSKSREEMGAVTKAVRKALGKKPPKLTKQDASIITDAMEKAAKATTEEEKARHVKTALEVINDKVPWGASDVLDTYRYNNMLSNPLTHIRNAWHNLTNAYFTHPATLIAEGRPKEALVYERAAIAAIPDGLEAFIKSWKGEMPIDLGKIDIKKGIRTPKGKVARVFTAPTRAMEAADKFFSAIIQAGEKARGKTPEEAYSIAEQLLLRGGLNIEGQGTVLDALDTIPMALYGMRRIPGAGWFIPFIRTPFNWAKMGLQYSPAGFTTVLGAANKRTQLAKAILGSIVSAYGAKIALEGRTTWSVPSNEDEKKYFYASGRRPYSVKIGDRWIPMATFGTFAFALALPAAAQHFNKESKTALSDSDFDKLGKTIASTVQFWSQSTPMSGVGGFVKILEGDIDYSVARNLGFTTGQLIPWAGLQRYIANALDPIYRKPSGYVEQIKSQIPGMTKGLEAYTEPSGEPAERPTSSFFTPYTIGKEEEKYNLDYETLHKAIQIKSALTASYKQNAQKAYQQLEDLREGEASREDMMELWNSLSEREQREINRLHAQDIYDKIESEESEAARYEIWEGLPENIQKLVNEIAEDANKHPALRQLGGLDNEEKAELLYSIFENMKINQQKQEMYELWDALSVDLQERVNELNKEKSAEKAEPTENGVGGRSFLPSLVPKAEAAGFLGNGLISPVPEEKIGLFESIRRRFNDPYGFKARGYKQIGKNTYLAPARIQAVPVRQPAASPTPARINTDPRSPQARGVASPEIAKTIMQAANTFGVSPSLMMDIAYSESSFDPRRLGPTDDVGLFQFTPPLWQDILRYNSDPNSSLYHKLPTNDRTDAATNALAAAYLIKFGQLGRWNPSKNKWGKFWSDKELNKRGYYDQTL